MTKCAAPDCKSAVHYHIQVTEPGTTRTITDGDTCFTHLADCRRNCHTLGDVTITRLGAN